MLPIRDGKTPQILFDLNRFGGWEKLQIGIFEQSYKVEENISISGVGKTSNSAILTDFGRCQKTSNWGILTDTGLNLDDF